MTTHSGPAAISLDASDSNFTILLEPLFLVLTRSDVHPTYLSAIVWGRVGSQPVRLVEGSLRSRAKLVCFLKFEAWGSRDAYIASKEKQLHNSIPRIYEIVSSFAPIPRLNLGHPHQPFRGLPIVCT